VTKGLHRYYGTPDRHFITGSCYRRQPELGTPERRDRFLKIFEEARLKYRFVVYGYVIMRTLSPAHHSARGAKV
jgi:hypothetical protein